MRFNIDLKLISKKELVQPFTKCAANAANIIDKNIIINVISFQQEVILKQNQGRGLIKP